MKLIYPDREFYASYQQAIGEGKENMKETPLWMDMEEEELMRTSADNREGRNLPEGYVPSTYLWLVDGKMFIGEINIRHQLTEALKSFGGHIGYWVRPSLWNQGMGTILLREGLNYIRQYLEIPRALITCNDSNIGSARVIEKNGGILEDKIINRIDGKERLTRRYWIEL